MTREQAMEYKSTDGKPMEWTRLDADIDDRVSETEWTGTTPQAQPKAMGQRITAPMTEAVVV